MHYQNEVIATYEFIDEGFRAVISNHEGDELTRLVNIISKLSLPNLFSKIAVEERCTYLTNRTSIVDILGIGESNYTIFYIIPPNTYEEINSHIFGEN